MARYALVASIGGAITTYPYTYRAFREVHPNVSFPREPDAARLREFNIVEVLDRAKPTYDLTKNIVEGAPAWTGQDLYQMWVEEPATAEQIAVRQRDEADETDRLAIKANSAIQAFVNMTPAQVTQYISNNSGSVVARVGVTEKLALMVLMLARREFRD